MNTCFVVVVVAFFFISFYKLSLFTVLALITFVHTNMNVIQLCLNLTSKKVFLERRQKKSMYEMEK